MSSLQKSRKGSLSLGDVPAIILSIVTIVVTGVALYLILAGLQAGVPTLSAYNYTITRAIGNFTQSADNVVSYAPTWGTILGVAVLIGIVLTALAFGRGKFSNSGGGRGGSM